MIFMNKNVFHEMLEKAEKLEKEYGSLERYAKVSTITSEKHKMKMKEELSSSYADMSEIYQELLDLEFADLLDFQNFNGRFDGEFN